jgi:hypothetical protein|tara:strand:- start:5855 stop:6097 length:243 start_codon:yes stop_codon:yes gene_type:complete
MNEMNDKFYKLQTESGMTTLNMAEVSAYSVVEIQEGMLKKNTYDVEIHLRSGTIFTTKMTESELTIWEDVFFPKSVISDE